MSNLFVVTVDGMYVTGQSHTINGGHYPVLEEDDMKYAKLYQTRNGAVSCLNKINRLWPDRIVNVHEIKIELGDVVKTNTK